MELNEEAGEPDKRRFRFSLLNRKKEGYYGMVVHVHGDPISREEQEAYQQRAVERYGRDVEGLDIEVCGDEVKLTYHLKDRPFERVRRITGYLVGTLDKWNNAKRAEERVRVKHDS